MTIITVNINGQERSLEAGVNVAFVLQQMALDQEKLAVELNGFIIPRSCYQSRQLSEGDRLEVVHAVGGG